jgi:hypothetical protein
MRSFFFFAAAMAQHQICAQQKFFASQPMEIE